MNEKPEARSYTSNWICVRTVSEKIHKYTQEATLSCTRETISWANSENKISVQEERKKGQEHKILSSFTLPQGLCPVLCKLAKISTKKDQSHTIQHLHPTRKPCSQ